MEFHSPERPHLGSGRPCWTTSPQVVLPHLMLDPDPEGGLWRAFLMVTEGLGGRWYSARVEPLELARLLANWRADPERTLGEFFGRGPPEPRAAGGEEKEPVLIKVANSAEELDL